MAKTNDRVRSTEDIAKGILEFGVTLKKHQNTLARLNGIFAGVSTDDTVKGLTHRVQTMLGYRKALMRMSRELPQLLTAFDAVMVELEG